MYKHQVRDLLGKVGDTKGKAGDTKGGKSRMEELEEVGIGPMVTESEC